MPKTTNTLADTPVRHDEDSITKGSSFSRFSRQNKRIVMKTKHVEVIEEIKNKNTAQIFHSSNVITSQGNNSQDVMFDSNSTVNEISMVALQDETDVPSASCEDPFRNPCNVEEKGRHSTPSIKKVNCSAMSSTPNQEILNMSSLRRSVASQTNFTLNGRENCDCDDEMKQFFYEVPEEIKQPENHTSDVCESVPSPLSCLWTGRLSKAKTPNDNKYKITRKLSLRSRTMISSAMGKSKDLLPRHKSLEESRMFSNTFSLLPRATTPPPQHSEATIHNPFEVDLSERLGKSIFSPNVFENVQSPSEDSEYCRWTIEDISSINPVPIDEDFTLPSDDEDPEKENQVQQEIERYFSETHLVLSPDTESQSSIIQSQHFKHHAAASTPQKMEISIIKEYRTASTQTAMSLPVTLQDKQEDSVQNFFQSFDTSEFDLSASNLRRKLFFHSEDEPPSPVRHQKYAQPAMKQSCINSPSYYDVKTHRHFSPFGDRNAFSSPEMSPVLCEANKPEQKNNTILTCKKKLHNYFPDDIEQNEEKAQICEVPMEMSAAVLESGDEELVAVPEGNNSLVLPASQDTGYQTEESWQHCRPTSMMASTPTHKTE